MSRVRLPPVPQEFRSKVSDHDLGFTKTLGCYNFAFFCKFFSQFFHNFIDTFDLSLILCATFDDSCQEMHVLDLESLVPSCNRQMGQVDFVFFLKKFAIFSSLIMKK